MDSANRNRAALAFVSLLAALAIGGAYLVRAKGDPGHLVGGYYATPDAAPTLCRYCTVRGPSEVWDKLGLDRLDGGSGLAAAKTCFHVPPGCEAEEAHVYEVVDAGLDPICEEIDGGVVCLDGGTPWAATRDLCATEVITLPDGIEYLTADEWERPYVPGEPVFEVWAQEHPQAPWRCACGAAGLDPKAGPCERLVPLYAKGKAVAVPAELGGGSYEPRVQLDGGVWEKVPPVEESRSYPAGKWRGNCTRMPCATWAGVDTLPTACRSRECDGVECGLGRAGGWCGPVQGYQKKDDAGNDWTCAANRWQRECPDGACGAPGRWYVKQCPCAPDAGTPRAVTRDVTVPVPVRAAPSTRRVR